MLNRGLTAFTLLIVFSVSNLFAQTTVRDTISLGPGYANQVYYNLVDGGTTSVDLQDWDLAFRVNGTFTAAIWTNEANGLKLYHVPATAFTVSLDTANRASWTSLNNSTIDWDWGAFNVIRDTSNQFDFGWGLYDLAVHSLSGSETFVLEYPDLTFKKVTIVSLATAGNIYTFKVANLDGTGETTYTIDKTNYPNRNFAYFDVKAGTELNLEPHVDFWNLLFSKALAPEIVPGAPNGGITYPAGTAYLSPENTVAVYQGADTSSDDYSTLTFDDHFLSVGATYRERISSPPPGYWQAVDSTVFFIKDSVSGDVFKVVFEEFEGTGTGNIVLRRTCFGNCQVADTTGSTTGIISNPAAEQLQVSLYPNPTQNNATLIVSTSKSQTVNIIVTDLSGRAVINQTIDKTNGTNLVDLNIAELNNGVYLVLVIDGEQSLTQKLIKY